MDAHFALSSRFIVFLQMAKFAIETIGLVGQSGTFHQALVDSRALKKLDHVTRYVALLVRPSYFHQLVHCSAIHKSKLASNEDKKGTKEAAVQALKLINSAKFVPPVLFRLP